jgi:hypothetical protein
MTRSMLVVRILWLLATPMLVGGLVTLMWGMHLTSVKLSLFGYGLFMSSLLMVMLAERIEHAMRVSPRRQQVTAFNPFSHSGGSMHNAMRDGLRFTVEVAACPVCAIVGAHNVRPLAHTVYHDTLGAVRVCSECDAQYDDSPMNSDDEC